jgi:hypothetical protein
MAIYALLAACSTLVGVPVVLANDLPRWSAVVLGVVGLLLASVVTRAAVAGGVCVEDDAVRVVGLFRSRRLMLRDVAAVAEASDFLGQPVGELVTDLGEDVRLSGLTLRHRHGFNRSPCQVLPGKPRLH